MSSLVIFLNSLPKGLASIAKYRLFGYFGRSGLIALLLLIFVLIASWYAGGFLGSILSGILPFDPLNPDILKWTGRLTSFVLAFIVFKYLVLIATGPLMSAMSEKVESKYKPGLPRTNVSFTYSIYRGVKLSLRNLFFEILLTVGILALNAIPFMTIIVPILLFLVQSYYAGIGAMDYTLERFKTVNETIKFGRQNRIATSGYGAIYLVILLIPLAGVFLSPVLTTAVSSHGTLDILSKK